MVLTDFKQYRHFCISPRTCVRLREHRGKKTPELEEYQETIENLVSNYLKHAKSIQEQVDFTMDELVAIINALASNKSPGEDKITTDLLKSAGLGWVYFNIYI